MVYALLLLFLPLNSNARINPDLGRAVAACEEFLSGIQGQHAPHEEFVRLMSGQELAFTRAPTRMQPLTLTEIERALLRIPGSPSELRPRDLILSVRLGSGSKIILLVESPDRYLSEVELDFGEMVFGVQDLRRLTAYFANYEEYRRDEIHGLINRELRGYIPVKRIGRQSIGYMFSVYADNGVTFLPDVDLYLVRDCPGSYEAIPMRGQQSFLSNSTPLKCLVPIGQLQRRDRIGAARIAGH